MPDVVVIGGANGAGKSTFARYVLPNRMPFLNADEIAKALPDDYADNRELESGRQLLRRMDTLAAESRSFAVETTLASRSLAPRLQDLQGAGYHVTVLYVWVPAPELSVLRVAARVQDGGHDIPTDTIFRRYKAGLINLFQMYMPIAYRWHVYANIDLGKPRVVCSKPASGVVRVYDAALWKNICEQESEMKNEGK